MADLDRTMSLQARYNAIAALCAGIAAVSQLVVWETPVCRALDSRPGGVLIGAAWHQEIGFTDGSKWPLSLAVVPISYMTSGAMEKDDPPSWAFFDDQEQRARYEEWQSKPSTDRTPRVVQLPKK
jgi:hypothetical protein